MEHLLTQATIGRAANVQKRLLDRGALDIKFFKTYPHYTNQTPDQQMNALCEIIEAMLDGKYSPAKPIGDSLRGR